MEVLRQTNHHRHTTKVSNRIEMDMLIIRIKISMKNEMKTGNSYRDVMNSMVRRKNPIKE